jgi:tetratricopeptide (TPR) repeat protein
MKHLPHILCLFTLFFSSCSQDQKLSTESPDALSAYQEGVRSLDLFYYAEAISAFERSLTLDSNFAMASARLALAHARTGNEVASKKEIAIAIRKSVNATREEQLFIRVIEHTLHFRNAQAAATTDTLIALSPKCAEAYMFRGHFFELNKNFDAALDMFKKAIKADTSYAMAVMSLGYAYSARGEFENAIEQMEHYIRLAPDAADPRASFADILFRAGRYDEALDQYNESLKLKPDYWYAINKIGDVYALLGRLNEADKQFDLGMSKTVLNNQVRATHLAVEAILQFQRGKYDEAFRLCEQSLALDSVNGKAAFARVMALIKLKKFDAAGATIEEIRNEIVRRNLAESQAMLEFHLLRAKLDEERGLFEEARASCDSAMEYGSELTRTDVYQELAEIHFKMRNFDEALNALEEALRYNPNNPSALLILAKVYKATGDRQMTSEIGNRLLNLWKNADSDFQPLTELKGLMTGASVPAIAS